jgi:ankyrin repeat protein
MNNDKEKVIMYLSNKKLLNEQNENGWTPLMVAIYNNSGGVTDFLLKIGANLNKINYKGTSALMYAKSSYVKTKDREILDKILSLGVDVNQKDYSWKSVLDYCDLNGETEVKDII